MWGNGRSPGKRGATHVGNAIDDHLAARRKLRDQPLPVFILGHSLGGLVTVTSALQDTSNLQGVILLAPGLKYDVSGLVRNLARVGGFLVPTFPAPMPTHADQDPTVLSRDPLRARLAKDPVMYIGKMYLVTAASGATTSHANWKQYQNFTVPVLAVHGTADASTDPSGTRQFIEAARSQDKTLSLLDSAHHAILDYPPSKVEALRIILDWIDRRLPKNGSVKP